MSEQVEEDTRRKLVITDEILARIQAHQKAENSPEARRERRIAKQKHKEAEKILDEVLTKPVTKARNRKLQKVLQIVEYYHGKHVRAHYAIDWLKGEWERYSYFEKTQNENEFIERLKYLKKMSFRVGDVYEKWESVIGDKK